MEFRKYVSSLNPGFVPVTFAEKCRSGLAAFAGILGLALGLHWLSQPLFTLIMPVSMAASAALIYAAPHSPMAQPWPLLGGHLISGIVGWACCVWIPDMALAAAIAVGLSILAMHVLNCLHPPGAATAMGMIMGAEFIQRQGWEWVLSNLLANIFLSLLIALVINNLLHGRRYPLRHTAQRVEPAPSRGLPDKTDIEWALQQVGGMVDVDEEELIKICQMASERAYKRVT